MAPSKQMTKRKNVSPTKAPFVEEEHGKLYTLGSLWLPQISKIIDPPAQSDPNLNCHEASTLSRVHDTVVTPKKIDLDKLEESRIIQLAIIAGIKQNSDASDSEISESEYSHTQDFESTNPLSSKRELDSTMNEAETDDSMSERDPFEPENESDSETQREVSKSNKPRGRPPVNKSKIKMKAKGSSKTQKPNRSQSAKKAGGPCFFCSTTESTYWRNRGSHKMCNPCGIRLKKYQVWCSECRYVPNKEEYKGLCPKCNIKFRTFKD